jgi:hypothetical protein
VAALGCGVKGEAASFLLNRKASRECQRSEPWPLVSGRTRGGFFRLLSVRINAHAHILSLEHTHTYLTPVQRLTCMSRGHAAATVAAE